MNSVSHFMFRIRLYYYGLQLEYLSFALCYMFTRLCEGVSKNFRSESITKCTLTFGIAF